MIMHTGLFLPIYLKIKKKKSLIEQNKLKDQSASEIIIIKKCQI